MAEQYDLTTPITQPSRNYYRIVSVYLCPESNLIVIVLRGSDNATISVEYNGSTAATLLSQLNTMNFGTISLQKRIILRLQADGKLPAGTISGLPD